MKKSSTAVLLALLRQSAAAPSDLATPAPLRGDQLCERPTLRRGKPCDLAAVPLPIPIGAGQPVAQSVVSAIAPNIAPFTNGAASNLGSNASSWLYGWWAAAGGAGCSMVAGQAKGNKTRRRRRAGRRAVVAVREQGAAAAAAEEEEEEEEEEETVQELKPVGGLPQASHPNGAMVFAVPATSPEEAMRQLAAASGQAEVPADWSIVATSAQPLRWDPLALGAQWVPELRPQQAPAAHLERCWRTPSQPSTAAGTETPQSNWETSSQATSMDHWQPEQSRPSPGQSRSALRWTAKDADQQIKELKRNDSRQEALARVQDNAWPMALSRHGCHIVQAALDVADKPRRLSMADAFRGRVREALKSPHANHVLQRCVAVLPPENVQFVVAEMEGFAREIARHPFGCRVLERLIEHCPRGQTERLAQEVIADVLELSRHPYGNYVVQHLLEHGTAEHRQGITRNLLPSARGLARHKIASNVVEKALTYCDDEMRQKLKQRMFSSPEELASLEHSNYGSFVVKELKRR